MVIIGILINCAKRYILFTLIRETALSCEGYADAFNGRLATFRIVTLVLTSHPHRYARASVVL